MGRLALLVVAVPFVAAAWLLAAPGGRLTGLVGRIGALATFLLAVCLARGGEAGGPLPSGEALGVHFAILTSFVALTTSWLGPDRMLRAEPGTLGALGRGRFSEAARNGLLGGTLLSVLAREPTLGWIGALIACGAACGLVALGRTEGSRQAARRLALGYGLGLAFALCGTVLLGLAVSSGVGSSGWEALRSAGPRAEPGTLTIAACFLLVGYGVVATLVPASAWLADRAAAEQPLAAALVLCVLPNLGLVAILRLRAVIAASPAAMEFGPALIALGLGSLLLSAASVWARREGEAVAVAPTIGAIIGGRGVAALAFGLGGAAATRAGLLQLTLLTLAGVAVLQCLSLSVPRSGGGLLETDRRVGLSLLAAVFGLSGLPPFGVFTSAFLIVLAASRETWLLALPLALGLAVLARALLMDAETLVHGEPSPPIRTRVPLGLLAPIWLALALTLFLGLAMPAAVSGWMGAL